MKMSENSYHLCLAMRQSAAR